MDRFFLYLCFMKRRKKKQIKKDKKHIIKDFDFGRVRKAMIPLEWKWAGAAADPPTVDELRKTAKRILGDVVSKYKDTGRYNFVEAGGFRAAIDDLGYLSLYFIIEQGNIND